MLGTGGTGEDLVLLSGRAGFRDGEGTELLLCGEDLLLGRLEGSDDLLLLLLVGFDSLLWGDGWLLLLAGEDTELC